MVLYASQFTSVGHGRDGGRGGSAWQTRRPLTSVSAHVGDHGPDDGAGRRKQGASRRGSPQPSRPPSARK